MNRRELTEKVEKIYDAIGVGNVGTMEHLTILVEALCCACKAAGLGEQEVLRVVRMTMGHPNMLPRVPREDAKA